MGGMEGLRSVTQDIHLALARRKHNASKTKGRLELLFEFISCLAIAPAASKPQIEMYQATRRRKSPIPVFTALFPFGNASKHARARTYAFLAYVCCSPSWSEVAWTTETLSRKEPSLARMCIRKSCNTVVGHTWVSFCCLWEGF